MNRRIPRGLFVTGTGTGVGKTQIAAALAHLLAERGQTVRPRKPVESGCRPEGGQLVAEDARTLRFRCWPITVQAKDFGILSRNDGVPRTLLAQNENCCFDTSEQASTGSGRTENP